MQNLVKHSEGYYACAEKVRGYRCLVVAFPSSHRHLRALARHTSWSEYTQTASVRRRDRVNSACNQQQGTTATQADSLLRSSTRLLRMGP